MIQHWGRPSFTHRASPVSRRHRSCSARPSFQRRARTANAQQRWVNRPHRRRLRPRLGLRPGRAGRAKLRSYWKRRLDRLDRRSTRSARATRAALRQSAKNSAQQNRCLTAPVLSCLKREHQRAESVTTGPHKFDRDCPACTDLHHKSASNH
jgi:hypothetical protein